MTDLARRLQRLEGRLHAQRGALGQRAPEDFVFDVKTFRLFTLHQTPTQVFSKDIQAELPSKTRRSLFYADVPEELREELWRQFREAIRPLADAGKLGVVRLQFPPRVVPATAHRWYSESKTEGHTKRDPFQRREFITIERTSA
jgi:uncharacterized protein YecE (DUF72 family)